MKRVNTRDEVISRLADSAVFIRRLGVDKLSLFGSFVRGDSDDKSDVDLVVEFLPGEKTFDHFMQLAFLLEDLLGRRVELVTPCSLSPHFGDHILQEAENVPLAA